MKEFILVFLGGGLGSSLRYLVSLIFQNKGLVGGFPLATLFVNILGSFIIGMGLAYIGNNSTHCLRYFLVVGFCGGFTTFSTFSFEALQLLRSSNYTYLALYLLISIIACIAMTYLGYKALS